MNEIVITEHAWDRLKERLGLPKRAVRRKVEMVYEKGLQHRDLGGHLKKYVTSIMKKANMKGAQIRVYGEHLYIFKDDMLITVYRLEDEYLQKRAEVDKENYLTQQSYT